MPQPRSATSNGGVIALILVGGAVATGAAALLWALHILLGFFPSVPYFLFTCLVTGVATSAPMLLARPRGPLAPIAAGPAAYVAVEVGARIGLILGQVMDGDIPPGGFILRVLEPTFSIYQAYELLAVAAAAGLAGLRVMTASKGGTSQPWNAGAPGGPFGSPAGPFAPGLPPNPGYAPMPGQGPFPGQPSAGQPMQPPAPVYQPPPVPGAGQGPASGGPQGAPPPHGGA
ncbi:MULTISPECIES: hypothetical protein [unclassified Actinomadura]|uniref:hypothetical protein n=1 Tax=unclassified Actinomadura TaxID=2626254 RepID=UPI0011EC78B5|nr:hypothetical protein [Actinomadura sp. K4S16]